MAFIPLVLLVCATVWAWFHIKSKLSTRKYPPGPYPLPILGNLLQLSPTAPRISLVNLSKKYGPLMYLKMGTVDTVVVSSPEMAKLVLRKHDRVLSGRTVPLCLTYVHDFHKYTMGFLPVGDQWRSLRKISNEHVLSLARLDASQGFRQEKLSELRDYVSRCCDEGRVIDIGEAAFTMTLNLMSATLCSHYFGGFGSESAQQIRGIVKRALDVLATPDVADFFPLLKVFDLQGTKLKTEKSFGKLFEYFQDIVDKRLASRSSSSTSATRNDFLDELVHLHQQNESGMTVTSVKFLIFDLVIAGTSTNAGLVEWAMTELLRNPDKMSKVRRELDTVIGGRDKLEESDIPGLSYLNAVVKETFRCHPPSPLLVPHTAEVDVELDGYMIRKDSQIIINVYAIGKDSRVWPNPNSFEPERFVGSEISYEGQNFELLPFGSGRRMCPGHPLAHRMVHLTLASLIHRFDWKLQGGMKPEEIDLGEKFGMALEKFTPLSVIPVKL